MSPLTCIGPSNLEIVPRQLGERFFTHLKVSFWLGFILAFPYIFYQLWSFIRPGLYDKEKKATRGAVAVCSILFICGVLFGYYIISPFGFKFLGGYTLSEGDLVAPSTSLSSYVGYLTSFTIPTGILFQMPVAVFLFARIGLLTPEFMKRYRKHALILILLLSAVVTPPDVVTQILVGIPIAILYESSIIIARRANKKYNENNP